MKIELSDIIQEIICPGVACHVPVSTRGEAYGADFRAVRHAGTLELLAEEPAYEGLEPFDDCLVVINPFECILCQE